MSENIENNIYFNLQAIAKYTTLVLVSISVFTKLLPIYLKYKHTKDLCDQLKGPKRWPVIGNAIDLFNKSTFEIFQLFQKWHVEYGNVFVVCLGPDFGVFLKKPQDVEIILSNIKHIEKSREYSYLETWLGTGLLTSTGQKWSTRRKLITPTFHFNILKQFVELFDEHANTLMQKLKKLADGTTINIVPIIGSYTLDVISETAMGVNLNSQNDPDIPYVKAIKITSELFMKRIASIIGRFNLTYKLFSPDYKESEKAIRKMHAFTDSVIKQRRARLHESNDFSVTSTPAAFETKRKLAFLDMLLQSKVDGESMTDENIREEVDTFMFEGHDTTSVALAFIIMLLSKHSRVQNKLFNELKRIKSDCSETITFEDLHQMKYLELVIKESLRLYPPVPLFGRTVWEDVQLTDNVLVPSGALVFLSIYQMQRDENNFKNALKFIPERFEDGQVKTNHFEYVPFSAGPRNCIGQKFAMLEMKYVMAKIILNFELLPTDHVPEVTAELVLRSLDGVTIRLLPRIQL